MKPIPLPKTYNYVAAFLTLKCNYRCSYCINRFGKLWRQRGHLSGEEWVRGLNRLDGTLPVTLQGGEPSLHPDFIYILNHLKPELAIDILTNLQFDADLFIARVDPRRIRRDAPYASIRVSYHPEVMALAALLAKVKKLQDHGFSIGVWGVLHPDQVKIMERAKAEAEALGIDFRFKEFLGEHAGRLHGTYRYQDACGDEPLASCECRTTELLIAPDGGVYRCHSQLYAGLEPVGNLLDPDFQIADEYRPCDEYGTCNPCDIKVKTNRFQQFGHTSVTIRNLRYHRGKQRIVRQPPGRPGEVEAEPLVAGRS